MQRILTMISLRRIIDIKNLSKVKGYVLKAIDYAKGYDLHQELPDLKS